MLFYIKYKSESEGILDIVTFTFNTEWFFINVEFLLGAG